VFPLPLLHLLLLPGATKHLPLQIGTALIT
jgi:hypothetical protein